jgi:undecaprenyl-diphosphatase
MNFFQSISLAVVQGLTEFLPVSSSGHLVLLQKVFEIEKPPVFFDALLHLGTLGAVLLFFKNEIFFLFSNWKKKINLWLILFLGTIPAVVFGLILSSKIELIFNSPGWVGLMWIIAGILLLSTKKFINKKSEKKEKLEEIKFSDSLVVGFFQAVALFPGISRSGSTIIGGLSRNFSPKLALLFSFLLSIPAVLGAVFLELQKVELDKINFGINFVSMVIAGVIGYFSLKLLQKVLISEKFFYFGYYCLILGITVCLFYL